MKNIYFWVFDSYSYYKRNYYKKAYFRVGARTTFTFSSILFHGIVVVVVVEILTSKKCEHKPQQ